MKTVCNIPKDLVSVKQGAAIARKSERTIWCDIRSGKLRGWGARRCYLVSLSELLPAVQASPALIAGTMNAEPPAQKRPLLILGQSTRRTHFSVPVKLIAKVFRTWQSRC